MGAKICGPPAIEARVQDDQFPDGARPRDVAAAGAWEIFVVRCRCTERMLKIVRAAWRLLWLAAEIIRGLITSSGAGSRNTGARWLQKVCGRALRILAISTEIIGKIPASGLLIANHLSYLDILSVASLRPCVFVAKSEVQTWPVFGWFARMAGTIFVNRGSRRDTARAGEAIRAALRDGALVVLFPEGTSSNGATVLPFKSSLLEAAIGERVSVSVAAIHYTLHDGNAGAEACYWGGHTLVPHLLNLLTKRVINASLSFREVQNSWGDRKTMAAQLHAEVSRLHASQAESRASPSLRRPTPVSGRKVLFSTATH
jgi:1-acyl-sn-glycerol-3-phosphate acyltransferase